MVNTLLEDSKNEALYKLYNIGNSSPVKLLDFIEAIEEVLETNATKDMLPMQAGDVYQTWAEVLELKNDYSYKSKTPVKDGVSKFIEWYKLYYKV